MGTVVVLSADRTMELINTTFVNAVVNIAGELVLTKPDGATVNVGPVKVHDQLIGLGDDDHTQYALANGTRGSFASVAQGAKADAARVNQQAELWFEGGDGAGVVETVTITDDGSSTSTWLSRLVYRFRESGLVGALVRNTFLLNEYGEIRVAPAKHNTTALRAFTKEFPNNPTATRDPDAPVVELMNDRTNRNSLRGWLGDGTQTRNGIKMSDVLVLSAVASVPAGTPANTVIVRTT